jgi:hypothetical protein
MIATDNGILHSKDHCVTASGSTAPPPWKSPSRHRVAIGVDLPPHVQNRLPRDVDDGGTDPTTLTSAAESASSTPLVAPRQWDLGSA